mgnify:FL=1
MDDKCLTYTKRLATFVFEGDSVCCARCPALETYSRKMCRLTGVYISDDRVTSQFCPLVDPTTGEVEGQFAM